MSLSNYGSKEKLLSSGVSAHMATLYRYCLILSTKEEGSKRKRNIREINGLNGALVVHEQIWCEGRSVGNVNALRIDEGSFDAADASFDFVLSSGFWLHAAIGGFPIDGLEEVFRGREVHQARGVQQRTQANAQGLCCVCRTVSFFFLIVPKNS